MKTQAWSLVLGIALVVSALILKLGMVAAPVEPFQLLGHNGQVFRINEVTGRVDLVFPGPDGTFLIPIWQMNPGVSSVEQLTDEQRAQWANMGRVMSAYMNGVRFTFKTQAPEGEGKPADPEAEKAMLDEMIKNLKE